MSEARGLAEAQLLGNAVDRQLIIAQQLLGAFKAQFIEQHLVAAAQIMQMSAQGACRTVHLLGEPLQTRGGSQLRRE